MKYSVSLTKGRRLTSSAVRVSFVRSSGPGGQNVNKVSTKVQLHVDTSFLEKVLTSVEFARLCQKLKNRMDQNGQIFLSCDETRHQKRNLEIALKRLEGLLRGAIVIPKKRRKTKPTKSSIERRLKGKKLQSEKKSTRKKVSD